SRTERVAPPRESVLRSLPREAPMPLRVVPAIIVALSAVVLAQQPTVPDLVLLNGRVYTVDPSRPWAEAVAITGDRIVAVGTTPGIRALAGPRTRTLDLRGAFVAPGFNDAHVHIDATGALLVGVNLLDVHEPNAFRARIREAAGRLPAG